MVRLKGSRTLLFGMATAILPQFGLHISPDFVSSWGHVLFPAIGCGIIGLRLITSSPALQSVERALGLDPQKVQDDLSACAQAYSEMGGNIGQSLDDLNAAVSQLNGHPLLNPDFVSALHALVSDPPGDAATAAPADSSVVASAASATPDPVVVSQPDAPAVPAAGDLSILVLAAVQDVLSRSGQAHVPAARPLS